MAERVGKCECLDSEFKDTILGIFNSRIEDDERLIAGRRKELQSVSKDSSWGEMLKSNIEISEQSINELKEIIHDIEEVPTCIFGGPLPYASDFAVCVDICMKPAMEETSDHKKLSVAIEACEAKCREQIHGN